MKKSLVFLSLLLISLFPNLAPAQTNEEREGRAEISQGWVNQHNEKLDAVVKAAVKHIRAKKEAHVVASLHKRGIPTKRLHLSQAPEFGIPLQTKRPDGTLVALTSLRRAKAEGQLFLIADYSEESKPLLSSADIYMKIGLIYRPLFHGQGYPGCARLMTLGKSSPLFFEIGTYGGGARCDKTLYTLNTEAVKGMAQKLYDHPESVEPSDFVKEALAFNVWLEGATLYQDVDRDGALEIVNVSKADYPEDLKAKLKDKYHLEENDFVGPFRKIASVYKWDSTKASFNHLGDYYF